MRRKILRVVLCALTVPCLCSCTTVLPEEMGGSGEWVVSKQSSYFEDYVSETSDESCSVKGNVYLFAEDAGVCRFTSAKESEIDLQGSVRNVKGDVRLVCEATDGVQTILVEGEDHKIEKTVMVSEGEGEIYFTGEGSCEFKLEMTAGEKVSFDDGMEKPEPHSGAEGAEDRERDAGTEDAKDRKANVGAEDAQDWKSVVGTEDAEDQKQDIGMGLPDLDDMENGERAAFPGLTDNWPGCIVLEDKGMSSSPLSVAFQVEKPMKIALSCMTTGGSLRVKIVNDGGQKVYFNKKDPEGDYEISVDEAGTCYMEIYAENHKGSIRIAPAQQ